MSHLTKVKTVIKNPHILEEVLISLIQSLPCLEGSILEKNAKIVDFFGAKSIVDFVVRRKSKGKYNDFGFLLNDEGEYEFISDNDAKNKREFLSNLMPLYARENTLFSLISEGFEIQSQIEENGTVTIIAAKWA